MQNPWLVIKLGGTSVSSRQYWNNVVTRLRDARENARHVIVVHSALAGVTNLLERLAGESDRTRQANLVQDLVARHEKLALELDIRIPEEFRDQVGSLEAFLAEGPAISPERRAHALGYGEYLLSPLAHSFLESQHIPVNTIDARTMLRAQSQPGQHPSRHFLSARCEHSRDEALSERLAQAGPVILTQGFVASDADGAAVLLGRGGSDTSAACLAAKIGAAELEIWTDVPGLFTADPHRLPTARLLKQLTYDEALEIAASGARALHPRCIRAVQETRIPLTIRYTCDPGLHGTRIHAGASEPDGRLKAVCARSGITTLTLETADMWQQAGFLADVFACFKRHQLSVDMISTSETNITLTLDAADNPMAGERVTAIQAELETFGTVTRTEGCTAISLVGHRIRANLHRIAPLLEIFADHRVHLLSQASNDLNMTFVVDEKDAPRLLSQLHAVLVNALREDTIFGPSWHALHSQRTSVAPSPPWWRLDRHRLIELAAQYSPCYVYDPETIKDRINSLKNMSMPRRIFYAIKANCHPDVLRLVHECEIGFECVSLPEVAHVLNLFPDIERQRILFTPNFAPRGEYE
ncbi:MAG TPA: aspartate kinase, partial [Gammaproteobacteria bacterium]|nr:aspartate kinase [Gammaproteobacteria bacterium]